jgi:hypothetical protein
MNILNFDEITKFMRKLAKSYKYQSLFSLAKEIKLKIFENEGNFSDLQCQFLSWIMFYYNIKFDIDMGDITEKVLENNIYEDAYMYWKHKNKGKEKIVNKNPNTEPQKSIQWIFQKNKR